MSKIDLFLIPMEDYYKCMPNFLTSQLIEAITKTESYKKFYRENSEKSTDSITKDIINKYVDKKLLSKLVRTKETPNKSEKKSVKKSRTLNKSEKKIRNTQ